MLGLQIRTAGHIWHLQVCPLLIGILNYPSSVQAVNMVNAELLQELLMGPDKGWSVRSTR